jgi:hypothetical protein
MYIEETLGELYTRHRTVVTTMNFYVMYVSVYRRDFRWLVTTTVVWEQMGKYWSLFPKDMSNWRGLWILYKISFIIFIHFDGF